MKKSYFQDWRNEDQRFKQIGDYVLIKNKEDFKAFCKIEEYVEEHAIKAVTSFPVLWHAADGEENLSFLPLSKEEVRELLQELENVTE
jgi:hypothetical protein